MAEAAARTRGGRVVLITGATSSIGQATAVDFAKLGDKVAITGLEQAQLDQVLNELYEASPIDKALALDHFLAIQANFEHEDQVEQVVPKVVAKFKRLDVLINNASCLGPRSDLFDETYFSDFQKILQVNLMSAVRLAQMAAPHLSSSGESGDNPAVLINVGSEADGLASKRVGYCVSKAGVTMLIKTLANSFQGKKVRVLCVAPEPIATTNLIPCERSPILDIGRRATMPHRPGFPSKVARLIVFLASDKVSYMHGCTVGIDGSHMAILGQLSTGNLD